MKSTEEDIAKFDGNAEKTAEKEEEEEEENELDALLQSVQMDLPTLGPEPDVEKHERMKIVMSSKIQMLRCVRKKVMNWMIDDDDVQDTEQL